MNQSRLGSLIEAAVNVAIGLAISLVANYFVFPMYGFVPSFNSSVQITLIYTGISVVRQYVLRRWFNARLHRLAQRVAGYAA